MSRAAAALVLFVAAAAHAGPETALRERRPRHRRQRRPPERRREARRDPSGSASVCLRSWELRGGAAIRPLRGLVVDGDDAISTYDDLGAHAR